MKIAMIGQKGIPSRSGGVEVHVEKIAERLVEKGCIVEVYCRKGHCEKKRRSFHGVRTIFLPYLNSKSLEAISHSFLSTLLAILRRSDIIHFHALGPSTLAFLPRIFGIKVVCTIHGLDWQRSKWGGFSKKVLTFGEYAAARFANRIISVSRSLVDYFKGKYGRNVEFIGNGIELKESVPADLIKTAFGLEAGSYLLYLGRLVPEKGIHYLIEAYSHVITGKKLVIAGGSSHSDEYEKELHDLAGSNEGILFTGFVQGRILEELISNTWLYILPSDVEGMPISLLEAMSYGKCCLVSDISENRDVISTYGYTFRQGDSRDLAEKLQMLLRSEELVHRNTSGILEYARDHFDWDRSAQLTYDVYCGMLQKKSRGTVRGDITT